MIFSFTSLCFLFASVFIPIIYLKKYSDEDKVKLVKDILISLGYDGIYYYSVLQIKANNFYKKIEPHINKFQKQLFKSETPKVKTQIEIICKDGKLKNKIDIAKALNEIKVDDIKEHIDDKFELMIVTSQNDRSNIKNKLCCTNITNDICYELSRIKFMNLSITHNDKTYNIDLKNEKHNFYIVNNKINKSFLRYYLVNILNLDVSEVFNYKLQLLDHEVNILHLDETHDIIIEKDNYRIENNKCNIDEISNITIKGAVNAVKEVQDNKQEGDCDVLIDKEIDDSSDDFEKIDEIKL